MTSHTAHSRFSALLRQRSQLLAIVLIAGVAAAYLVSALLGWPSVRREAVAGDVLMNIFSLSSVFGLLAAGITVVRGRRMGVMAALGKSMWRMPASSAAAGIACLPWWPHLNTVLLIMSSLISVLGALLGGPAGGYRSPAVRLLCTVSATMVFALASSAMLGMREVAAEPVIYAFLGGIPGALLAWVGVRLVHIVRPRHPLSK
jgi:hypothetical protein